MIENQTIIDNQKGRPHKFFYDYSFCSMDRAAPNYASQQIVFSKIGLPLIDRCMDGYNCCHFAYGQTSSGKSYRFGDAAGPPEGSHFCSMMGSKTEPGIIPRFSEELFTRIGLSEAKDVRSCRAVHWP